MTIIKKIVVAGGGILGSQIAFQSAYSGVRTVIWIKDAATIPQTEAKLKALKKQYRRDGKISSKMGGNIDSLLTISCDLEGAVHGADILIEAIPEDKSIKTKFYVAVSSLLDEKTIVTTNSSTLLPSSFAKKTGRPERFIATHFSNHIWKNNIVEIMPHSATSNDTLAKAILFAKQIGMIPLPVLKEKSGYLLNSMLVPFLLSALSLVADGVADFRDIDTAWTVGTGSPHGPFEIIDIVGLETTYNIARQYHHVPRAMNPVLKKMMLPYNFEGIERLLKKKVDEGKMGKTSGEGFYKY